MARAFGALSALFIALLIIAKNLKKYEFNIGLVKAALLNIKKGSAVFFSQLAPFLYNHSAAFLLGLFVSFEIIGFYYAALKNNRGFHINWICNLKGIVCTFG